MSNYATRSLSVTLTSTSDRDTKRACERTLTAIRPIPTATHGRADHPVADAYYHRVLLREAPATVSGYKTRPRAAPSPITDNFHIAL